MRWVVADAGLDVADEAVDHVVRQGGGSARDTLSALDQVVAAGGVVDRRQPRRRARRGALRRATPGRALVAVADAMSAGRDPRTLGEALLGRLRDVFLVRMGAPDRPGRPKPTATGRRRGPSGSATAAVTRALEALGRGAASRCARPPTRASRSRSRSSASPGPSRPPTSTRCSSRIERLEQALAGPARARRPRRAERRRRRATGPPEAARRRRAPAPAAPAAPAARAPKRPPPKAAAAHPGRRRRMPRRRPRPPSTAAVPDRDALTLAWGDAVLPRLKRPDQGHATASAASSTPRTAAPCSRCRTTCTAAKCEQKRPEVEAALHEHFGRPLRLQLVVDQADGAPAAAPRPAPRARARADEHDRRPRHSSRAPDVETGVDRLTDAFPGAELLQEES